MKKNNVYFFSIGCIIALFIFIVTNAYSQGNWILQNSGTTKSINTLYFLNANTGFAAGDSGLILKTTNSGTNWIIQTSGTFTSIECIQFTGAMRGYATGGQYFLSTTNGGVNWQVTSVGASYRIHSLYFINDSAGFLAGGQNLFKKTSNYGINWTNIPIYATIDSNYCLYFINANTGFVACDFYDPSPPHIINAAVCRTTNAGNNWQWRNCYLRQNMGKVHFGNLTNGMAVGIMGGVSRTTNTGELWDSSYSPSGQVRAVFMTSGLNAFLVGNSGKIYRTGNFGASWLNASYSTSANFKCVYFINDTVGFVAGTGGIIIKTTVGGVSGLSKIQSTVPDKYDLKQNFPNPFNPETNIIFEIPKNSLVKINIFDVNGKEVATLVNEYLNAGRYEHRFIPGGLSSGIYFVNLISNGIQLTKKIMLVK